VYASGSGVTPEEKFQALERILQSRTFVRCDQLKSVLRFVCLAEIEGHAEQLSEYVVGVEALGRPTSFNPGSDSSVRSRAYDLRQKLKKFYSLEATEEPVRIEIEKGAYVPRFVRVLPPATPQNEPETQQAPAPGVPPLLPPPPAPVAWWKRPYVLLAAVNALVLAAGFLLFHRVPVPASRPAAQDWTPELEAFWKPFLSDRTPLLVAYETRLFFFARPLNLIVRYWNTNELSELETAPPLQRLKKELGVKQFVESRNYADFGTVNSVFLLTQLIGQRQRRIALKRSEDTGWDDIWNNNLIFIGKASIHPAIRAVLNGGDFVEDISVIRNLRPKPGERAEYTSQISNDGVKYAMISRFPGPQRGRYVLIVSATHSELPWAVGEYITNPLSMKELVDHIRLPSGEIPDSFQAILEVTLQSQVPVKIRYVTHHVVAAPEFPRSTAPANRTP
jgi:hypothetical protein